LEPGHEVRGWVFAADDRRYFDVLELIEDTGALDPGFLGAGVGAGAGLSGVDGERGAFGLDFGSGGRHDVCSFAGAFGWTICVMVFRERELDIIEVGAQDICVPKGRVMGFGKVLL